MADHQMTNSQLKSENVMLRKILAHISAKIVMKAKEDAGFGTVITLAEVTEECDHEWETIDHSFDHEYGCEVIVFERCEVCGIERECKEQGFQDDVIGF